MSRFVLIGDVHDRVEQVVQALDGLRAAVDFSFEQVAGVLLVGDLSSAIHPIRRKGATLDSYPREQVDEWETRAGVVLDGVQAVFPAARVLMVPGNHDWPVCNHPGNIDGRTETIGGIPITGIGGAPCQFGFPYDQHPEAFENTVQQKLPGGRSTHGIILSHSPPFGLCDQLATMSAESVGSRALRDRARNHRGLFVCGHIHEAAGHETIGDACLVVNLGSFGPPHATAMVAVVEMEQTGDWKTVTFFSGGRIHRTVANEEGEK